MLSHPSRIEIHGDVVGSAPFAAGPVAIGDLEVQVHPAAGWSRSPGGGPAGDADLEGFTWSVANTGDAPVRVRSVAVVVPLGESSGPLRMFRNGYQSWSPTGVATFGIDADPSLTPRSVEMVRAMHHADVRVARPGELRSEWVTVLQAGAGAPVLVGFDGGSSHDGTLRLRPGPNGPELWIEAFLGDVRLDGGARRDLHEVLVAAGAAGGVSAGGTRADASALLEGWAAEVGRRAGARTHAPYQVGWCSWYHYFHDVTEADVRANLARAGEWPFDVFQVDDGFQSAIGDWLTTNDRFASGVGAMAASIAEAGYRPGLWIAPFIVAPDSDVATAHPEWLARDAAGEPLLGMYNAPWGGGRDGFMWALDTTLPEVGEHLAATAAALVEAGYTYLKLDFTFAPSFEGVWADPTRTPAERVRAGYEAVRRGAGDDTFILGCGVPLSNVVGVVDANRIGPDVAPQWSARRGDPVMAGYENVLPATQHGWKNTLSRAFMHRRLWLNDPDCLMLRVDETDLEPDQARTWAHAVAVSGGMALVSDDLNLLDEPARQLLDEVIAIGRQADAAAGRGESPRCDDLMAHALPHELHAAGHHLVADPAVGTSTLDRPGT